MDPGQTATIRGSGGTIEIVVVRPAENDLSNNGVQVESLGTTVNLPPGLAMQAFGSGLGGGNARVAVTTFSNRDGTFRPQNSLSLGTTLVDISLLDDNEIVPVLNLDRNSRVMFELQRNVSMQRKYICTYYYIIDHKFNYSYINCYINCFNFWPCLVHNFC